MFDYRGRVERSLPGEVVVLHPDETHDGRAGTRRTGSATGSSTSSRPASPRPCARSAGGRRRCRSCASPSPANPTLARAIDGRVPRSPGAAGARRPGPPPGRGAARRGRRATAARPRRSASTGRARPGPRFLDDRRAIVRSTELEAVTGLSRYELARQFRAALRHEPVSLLAACAGSTSRGAGCGAGTPLVDAGAGGGLRRPGALHAHVPLGLRRDARTLRLAPPERVIAARCRSVTAAPTISTAALDTRSGTVLARSQRPSSRSGFFPVPGWRPENRWPRTDERRTAMTPVTINGKRHDVDLPDDTPLLWALRDDLGLTGTKFGCGMALCGACTVHLDGQAVRVLHDAALGGGEQEGHHHRGARRGQVGKAVQAAWVDVGVPQCGYCQAGQIMSATALLKRTPKPTDADIDERHERQHLPLRHLHAHPRRDQAGGGPAGSEGMNAPVDRSPSATVARSTGRDRQREPAPVPPGRCGARRASCSPSGVPQRRARRRSAEVRRGRHAQRLGRQPAGLRRHRRGRHGHHRLPPLRDGAGRAHRHADDRRRRARSRLEARARRAGARRREEVTATRTPTARAARATSSSRCAAAAPPRAPCSRRRPPRSGGCRSARWRRRTTRSCIADRPAPRLRSARQGRRQPAGAGARDAAPQGSVEVPLHRQGPAEAGRRAATSSPARRSTASTRAWTACSTRSSRARPSTAARSRASTTPRRSRCRAWCTSWQIEATPGPPELQSARRRRGHREATPGRPCRAARR